MPAHFHNTSTVFLTVHITTRLKILDIARIVSLAYTPLAFFYSLKVDL